MQRRHALIVEWDLATNEDVEDDAEAPHVYFRASVGPGLQELRGGKIQAAAKGLEVPAWRKQVAQTKVDNLDVAILADEDVFDFKIAVDNAVAVAVVEGAGNLAAELARLLFLELAMGDDVVEHLTAVDKLEEHVPVIVCADNIAQAADMGMIEEGDYGGFAGGTDFLGLIGALLVGSALVIIFGRATRNNFAGDLLGKRAKRGQHTANTKTSSEKRQHAKISA